MLDKKLISKETFYDNGGTLEKLHLSISNEFKNLDESEQNKISISFYETSKSLKTLYKNFIEKIISPFFSDAVYFQTVPTFRFHFPNQEGYNWKDRYHTDIMLGHPPYEINIWLPFTKTYDSNSMRITSYDDSMSFMESCDYDFEVFAERVQYDVNFSEMLRNFEIQIRLSVSLSVNKGRKFKKNNL